MVDLVRARFDPAEVLIEILVFGRLVLKERGKDGEFVDDDRVGFGGIWNEDWMTLQLIFFL